MTYKRVGAYVGIDPTAGSMHVGHLVPLMSLFWLYINGCHSVSLVRTPNHTSFQDLIQSIAGGRDGEVWGSSRPTGIKRKATLFGPKG